MLPPFSLAAELQTIQARGKLRVAVKDNSRPFGFRGADGVLQGFEIEIAQRLAQELLPDTDRPTQLELVPVTNSERLAVVLADQVDFAIARVTATEMRSRVVVFSLPYYLDGTALVTKQPTLRRTWDANNRQVAVLSGASTAATLRDRLPTARLISVNSYAAAKDLLDQGKADAFAADAGTLSGWVQEFPEYRLLAPLISVEPLCIVLPKGLKHDELRRRINTLLESWHAAGWLKARANYWGLPWQKELELEKVGDSRQ